MKSRHPRLYLIFFAVTVSFNILFSACNPISTIKQKSWIDLPFHGASFQAGESIPLMAHVYADGGVAEVQCALDSIPYHRGAPQSPGSSFTVYTQDVTISEPGSHVISVVAFDMDGNSGNPAYVEIYIEEEPQPPEEESPSAPEPKTKDTPSPDPTPADIPSPEPDSVPQEEVSISFWADQNQLQQGECTLLHWNVQNADSISLDNTSVSSSGSQQVCPTQSTSFTLSASNAVGSKQQSLTISISSLPQVDQDGPNITNITHSPQKIWNYYTCGTDAFTVSASVSDASAISRVSVRFRVIKGAINGNWIEKVMGKSAGDYQVIVGPDDLKQSMAKYWGTLEYKILAEDVQGNASQSKKKSLEIGDCLL